MNVVRIVFALADAHVVSGVFADVDLAGTASLLLASAARACSENPKHLILGTPNC